MRGIDFNPSRIIQITLSPALVPTVAGGAEQTFTVKGLKVGDVVLAVVKPTTQAGLGIGNARVSAADTLAINFTNCSGSDITPTASQKYLVAVVRPDSLETDGAIQFR